MIYKVTCKQYNDNAEYVLHQSNSEKLRLIEPKLFLELNKSGTFTFKIHKLHPYCDKILKMGCEINVYRDSKLIYIGRPLTDDEDFYGTKSITCEGILAYLLDSIQRPYSYTGTIRRFFDKLINNHNATVDSFKNITHGTVTVVDSNNYINRSTSDYTTTLQALNEKLIDTHAGYLMLDYETRTLDYLSEAGERSKQIIRFGNNLLDLNKYIKSDDLITAVIPLGAETDVESPNGTKKKLTIESVNDGKDYLIDKTAVSEFGVIFGTVNFDDVTLPQNLKRKGQEYLDKSKNLSLTIELTALDLSCIDVDVEKFSLGEQVRIISKPHDLDSYFLLSKLEIDLINCSNNKITLGKTRSKLTSDIAKKENSTAAQLIKQQEQMSIDVYNAIDNATALVTGGKGGYLFINKNEDGQPDELYILDKPSVEDAKNVIRLNKNGLGFSTSGYNGTFKNAWTIDGSLVADFITTGSLNAGLIKSGTISFKNNKGKINIDTGEMTLTTTFTNGLTGTFNISPAGLYFTDSDGVMLGYFYPVANTRRTYLLTHRLSIAGTKTSNKSVETSMEAEYNATTGVPTGNVRIVGGGISETLKIQNIGAVSVNGITIDCRNNKVTFDKGISTPSIEINGMTYSPKYLASENLYVLGANG